MTAAWLWIVAGLALGAVEMLSFSYFLIWPGLAAVVVGLLLFVFPTAALWTQVTIFAVLAIALTVVGRAVVSRRAAPVAPGGLNRRAARLVGREVRVRAVSGGLAEVEVDGEIWRARGEGLAPGDAAIVSAVDGAMLLVYRPG